MGNTSESNEVAGHAYRQAQARRLIRWCGERGVSYDEIMAGQVESSFLDPICDEQGKIVPEAVDFDSAN